MSEPEQPLPARAQVPRLSPLTPVARRAFVAGGRRGHHLATTCFAGRIGPFACSCSALLVAGAVYGYASWLRTKYWIDGTSCASTPA